MQVIKFGAVILLFCISSNIAISCYQCTYVSNFPDNTCNGPDVASTYLHDCPTLYDYCSTEVEKSDLAGTKVTTITRRCPTAKVSNQCNNVAGVDTCIYICDTNGCNNGNGSKMVTASRSTFLISICISLLFLKL